MNNKIFLSVATMIVTGFAIKTWRKMHQKPLTREETYRAMRDAREQWLREHQPKCPAAEADPFTMRHDPSAALGKIDASFAMGSCR